MELKDYAGVFHIHTTMSDGTGDIYDIVKAGHRAGLDFLFITDHDTVAYRTEGFEGWYGNLLVLVGQEVTPKVNHLVALGLDKAIVVKNKSDKESHIAEVTALGGFAVAVHPYHHPHYRRRFWKVIASPWEKWDRPEIGAVELWSFMADWVHPISLFNPFSMLYYIRRPDRAIEGPSVAVIREWDAITQRRRISALGGLDAHARRDPLHILCVFPYEFIFGTIRTHIIAPEFKGIMKDDEGIVFGALREGHCYISYDWLHDARGFMFECRSRSDRHWIMGDELYHEEGLALKISLPMAAQIKVVKDGKTHIEKESKGFEMKVEEAGVYRIEARLKGRPWIFSNPIYIRAKDFKPSIGHK